MNILRESVVHPHASLRFLNMRLEAFRGQRHRHHHAELTWIEHGSGLRSVGDAVQPFDDGDLVLVGSEVPHHWLSAAGVPRPRGALLRATTLQFAPDLCLRPALPELGQGAALLRRARRGLRIQGVTQAQVIRHLLAMREADDLARLAHLLAILSCMQLGGDDLVPIAAGATAPGRGATLAAPAGGATLAAAAGPGRTSPTDRGGEPPRRIDKVVDWMHQRLAQPITVAQAAQVAHVSPAAFSRFFKREVGRTFTQYLNDARCGEAWLRLQHTREPVAAIAHSCGFTTLSHFNEQFRRRHGVSPRALRSEGRRSGR